MSISKNSFIPKPILEVVNAFGLEESNVPGMFYRESTNLQFVYYIDLKRYNEHKIVQIKGYLNPVTTIDLTVKIHEPKELFSLIEIINR